MSPFSIVHVPCKAQRLPSRKYLKQGEGRYLKFLPGYIFHIPPPLRGGTEHLFRYPPGVTHYHKSATSRRALPLPTPFGLLHSPGTMASALPFHELRAIAFSRLAFSTAFGLFHSPGRKTIRNDFAHLPFRGWPMGHGPRFTVRALARNRKTFRSDFEGLPMILGVGLHPLPCYEIQSVGVAIGVTQSRDSTRPWAADR